MLDHFCHHHCNHATHFYRLQMKFAKVMFSQASVILSRGGGGVCLRSGGCLGRYLLGRHPPDRPSPQHYGIRSTNGRYASYWNAFLLSLGMDAAPSANELLSVKVGEVAGRSQNTVPIASTQVAIKGIVQYSTTHTHTQSRVSRAQFLVGHSREHTLSAVGPDAQVE